MSPYYERRRPQWRRSEFWLVVVSVTVAMVAALFLIRRN